MNLFFDLKGTFSIRFIEMELLVLLLLLWTFVFSFGTLSFANGNAELKALSKLKVALDPDSLTLSSWIVNGDPCNGSFVGITCNEHGNIANISLQGRGLTGYISPAISELKSLSGLFLHYNSLSGEIPSEITDLDELSEIYLNNNNLSGSIPLRIGNLSSLQVLQLSYNRISGNLPTRIGSLKNLTVLSLRFNAITGAIPASIGELNQLVLLDLSFNHLFGSVPVKLAAIPSLELLDVRNNSLSGHIPSEFQRLKKGFLTENNKDLCGDGFSTLNACTSLDLQSIEPKPTSTNVPQSPNLVMSCESTSNCSKDSRKSMHISVMIGVIGISFFGIFIASMIFSWYSRRKQKIGSAFEPCDSLTNSNPSKDAYRRSASPLINIEYSNNWELFTDCRIQNGFRSEFLQKFQLSLEDVENATCRFSDMNLLGKSSFSATYRGILRDGSIVAVKALNISSCKTEESEFLKGLKVLTSLQHDNLVDFRGFCCSRDRRECFLIHDFIENGSLSHYLDMKAGNGRVLDWFTRVSMINGIAKGIGYLHSNGANKSTVTHQNLSSENILIDRNFNPRISDSAIHKLLADDIVFSTLKNSAAMGYLAPEYTTTGKFTEKNDIYAFGVIIFQILSGKKRITESIRQATESGKFEELIDAKIHGEYCDSEATTLTKIALLCTDEIPMQRPTIETIIQELSKCSHERIC